MSQKLKQCKNIPRFLLPGGTLGYVQGNPGWTEGSRTDDGWTRTVGLDELEQTLTNESGKPETDCRNFCSILYQLLTGEVNNIRLYLGVGPSVLDLIYPWAIYLQPQSEEVRKYVNNPHVDCHPRGQWVLSTKLFLDSDSKSDQYIGLDDVVKILSLEEWRKIATNNLKKWISEKGSHKLTIGETNSPESIMADITTRTARIIGDILAIDPESLNMVPRKSWSHGMNLNHDMVVHRTLNVVEPEPFLNLNLKLRSLVYDQRHAKQKYRQGQKAKKKKDKKNERFVGKTSKYHQSAGTRSRNRGWKTD